MKRKILPFLALLFSMSTVIAQVNITFELNTATISDFDPAGISIAGGDGFGVPGDNIMTDDNSDGTYTITFSQPEGFSSFFTFVNGPEWGDKENIGGLPCANPDNFNDRFLPPVFSDTTILACFGTCDNDGTCTIVTDSIDITFQLNTATITDFDPAGISLAGGGNFGNPTENPMLDPDGDGIYTFVSRRPVGFSSYYTFVNGPEFGNKENISGLPCANPDNFNDRFLPPVFSDTTILACFENCADDGTCIDIQPPSLPIDFEGTDIGYNPAGFGGVNAAIIANPDMTGNESATVMHLDKTEGAMDWGGVTIDLISPVNLALGTKFTLKVWAPAMGMNIRFKMEDSNDATIFSEVDMTTTTMNAWETLEFDLSTAATYNAAHNYDRIAIFPDYGNMGPVGGLSSYFDDIDQVVEITNPVMPVDFESDDYIWSFGNFGGVDSIRRIPNPDPSGINTSSTVLQLNKTAGAEVWGGTFFDLAGPINTATTFYSLNVWSPNAGDTILIKMENSSDNSIAVEIKQAVPVANTWVTLTFDMASSTVGTWDPSASYDRMVIFPNFGKVGVEGGAFYYVDDLQESQPPRPSLPVDFESDGLTWDLSGFGEASAARIANPDMTGNESATVLEITKPTNAQVWAGMAMPLSAPINFTSNSLSMKVWSPAAGIPFRLKLEDTTSPPDGNGNPSVFAEVDVNSTTAMAWETLIYDMTQHGSFDPAINYNQVVIFPNIEMTTTDGATVFYFDDLEVYTQPIVLPTVPVTFEEEGITNVRVDFGGVNSAVIDNPDASGINTSASVLEMEKTAGAEVWGGVAMPLQTPIDLGTSTGNIFSIKVWSPKADVPFLLKFENSADAENIFTQSTRTVTTANTWVTLIFDISEEGNFDANATYNQFVVFADFGTAGAGETFYVDDLNHDVETNLTNLELEQVKVKAFPNPTEDLLNVHFEIPVSGQISISVVDVLGRDIQYLDLGNLLEGNYQQEMDLAKLNSGNYFLVMRLDGQIISTKNVLVK